MAAVDVGVGHDDDLVVARLLRSEIFTDPGAERGNDRLDFDAREHSIDSSTFDVQDLASNRKNRLGLSGPTLLCRAAGGIALDDEDFTFCGVSFLTVGELSRKAEVRESALSSGQISGLACGVSRAGCIDDLRNDRLRDPRVLFEKARQLLIDDPFDDAADFARAELRLRLPLEFGLRDLYGDDGRQALSKILAADRWRLCLALCLPIRIRLRSRAI